MDKKENQKCQDTGSDLAEQAKEHVGVERALVGLVHDDGAVVIQVRLPQRLPQQDAVRHVLDHCLLGRAVLEADGIAHLQGNGKKTFSFSLEDRGGLVERSNIPEVWRVRISVASFLIR